MIVFLLVLRSTYTRQAESPLQTIDRLERTIAAMTTQGVAQVPALSSTPADFVIFLECCIFPGWSEVL